MNIQAISPVRTQSFKGIEQKDDPNKKNVFINGAGGRIGKQAFRQHLLANHTPEGVNIGWDACHKLYGNQNLVGANMGSMGLKGDKNINDVKDEDLLTAFRNDSVMGRLPDCINTSIERKDGEVFLKVSSKYGEDETFALTATRDNEELKKMRKYNVNIVKDCTGSKAALSKKGLSEVREALGADIAMLSAPSKEPDKTVKGIQMVVPGVNSEKIDEAMKKDGLVSAASCTTTCVTPIAKVLEDKFGIDVANLETTHAATASQPAEDRTKADAKSKDRGILNKFIPTTTGAAKAAGKVIPSLNGVMDGQATRGPVEDGSMIILNAVTMNKDVTTESVTKALKEASEGEFKGKIAFAEKNSASCDVLGRPENALVIPEVKVTTGKTGIKLVTIKAYYDNEGGYTRSYSGTLGNEVAGKLIAQDKARA